MNISRYNIQIFHAIPSYEYLMMIGVQRAYPQLEMIIYIHENITNKYLYLIRLKITGQYYCNGTYDFEDVNVEYLEHEDAINDNIYNTYDENTDDNNIYMKEFRYYNEENSDYISNQVITIEDIINDQHFQTSIKKSLKNTIMEGYGMDIIEFIYDYLC